MRFKAASANTVKELANCTTGVFIFFTLMISSLPRNFLLFLSSSFFIFSP